MLDHQDKTNVDKKGGSICLGRGFLKDNSKLTPVLGLPFTVRTVFVSE
jgi:hypothetical protein